MKKTLTIIISVILICGCIVGGTMAWLTAQTQTISNTFTIGNINITLEETTGDTYKMIPGSEIEKDPTVTVIGGSEACWLFVSVVPGADLSDYLNCVVSAVWTELPDVANVWYCEVAASDNDQEFAVLQNNAVTVKEEVTKAMADVAATKDLTLSVTAYAIQRENINDAKTAWEKINSPANP